MNDSEKGENEENDWTYAKAGDQELSGIKRLASERREVGLFGAIVHGTVRCLTGLLIKLFLRITVEGRENMPSDAPFVLVANHSSHLDALLLSNLLPARFTGKVFSLAAADYFFDTPSKTVFATRMVNALPVRRGRASGKALGTLRERIVSGDTVLVIFPEGTRSRDGVLGAFKPGIGMLVAGTEVPVVPCKLRGAHEIWPPDRKFPRCGKLSIRIGEPVLFADQPNTKSGWLAISASLQEQVERL